MFRPPKRTEAGYAQFLQYVMWVEGVLDTPVVTRTVKASRASASSMHHRLALVRRACGVLRDGRVLLCLVRAISGDVEEARHEAPNETVDMLETVGVLSELRERLISLVVGVEPFGASAVHPSAAWSSAADVPSVQQMYAGGYDVVGSVLFHCFHQSVVRERFHLSTPMVLWYRDVARRFGIAHADEMSASWVQEHRRFDDGVLWILALHTLRPFDVSAVYTTPSSDDEASANLALAYCQMELQGVFLFFDTLHDLIAGRRNYHFMFMQSLHVYLQCEGRLPDARAVGHLRLVEESKRGALSSHESVVVQLSSEDESVGSSALRGSSTSSLPGAAACRVAVGSSNRLVFADAHVFVSSDSLQLMTDRTWTLPFEALERCQLGRGRLCVVLQFGGPVPTAPPPYDDSAAPAISLFFSDTAEAEGVYTSLIELLAMTQRQFL